MLFFGIFMDFVFLDVFIALNEGFFLVFFDICQLKQTISFQCSLAIKIWEIFEPLHSVFIKHRNFRVETAKQSLLCFWKSF